MEASRLQNGLTDAIIVSVDSFDFVLGLGQFLDGVLQFDCPVCKRLLYRIYLLRELLLEEHLYVVVGIGRLIIWFRYYNISLIQTVFLVVGTLLLNLLFQQHLT